MHADDALDSFADGLFRIVARCSNLLKKYHSQERISERMTADGTLLMDLIAYFILWVDHLAYSRQGPEARGALVEALYVALVTRVADLCVPAHIFDEIDPQIRENFGARCYDVFMRHVESYGHLPLTDENRLIQFAQCTASDLGRDGDQAFVNDAVGAVRSVLSVAAPFIDKSIASVR